MGRWPRRQRPAGTCPPAQATTARSKLMAKRFVSGSQEQPGIDQMTEQRSPSHEKAPARRSRRTSWAPSRRGYPRLLPGAIRARRAAVEKRSHVPAGERCAATGDPARGQDPVGYGQSAVRSRGWAATTRAAGHRARASGLELPCPSWQASRLRPVQHPASTGRDAWPAGPSRPARGCSEGRQR